MIRQHHPLKVAVALSAIAAALLVAACGGSSSSGKAGGATTVRAAYLSSTAPGCQIAIKVTGTAAGHPINVTGTGTFAEAAHAYQLTMHINRPTLGGGNPEVNVLILGKHFYVKLPVSLAGQIPGGKPWLGLNLADLGKPAGMRGLSSLAASRGENPAQFLRSLRAASATGVQNLGHQTIDGVSTTGLRATVDLSKVVDTLPASQRPSASSVIASIGKLTGLRYMPVKVWVDTSNHLRRIDVSEAGRVAGQPFSENVRLDFVKYGPEPVPAAPPADEVTNIMSLASAG